MILRRIAASGFMRYQALDLGDLPDDGAIAILGENEAGKTTIGECIAFALFGETVKSRATDISQVVSWDAEDAKVTLEFEARGATFRVERRVDKRGGHEAKLERAGRVVADGPEAVLEAIRDLTGLTFDEFRASFYLAQTELGLVRRGDGEAEGRRAVREIVGIAALERAAASCRAELAALRERADGVARQHAVAKALAEAQALPPGFGEELDREKAELEAEAAAAQATLPGLEARIARLREAAAARTAANEALARVEGALLVRRGERASHEAREEAAALARGLEAESKRVKGELAHCEKAAQETRAKVDRLIEYQAKMAELEARLDLYRLEVRRALEAPEIDTADVAALEGVAMPSTAAAGLKLSEARVGRLRRSRNRAVARAVVFAGLTILFGVVGLPSLAHVWPQAAKISDPETGLASFIESGLGRFFVPGTPEERGAWLALACAGCGGALLFLVLGALQVKHALSRSDSLRLATEGRDRLRAEVKDLEAEREKLERLDLKKPLRFAEDVKELRNPSLRERFEKMREGYNDFIGAPEQGDSLVAKERAAETALRAETAALEARLARLTRIARLLPAVAAEAAEAGPATKIGADLEAIEERVGKVLEALYAAEHDRREGARALGDAGVAAGTSAVATGAASPTPEAAVSALRAAVEALFAAWPGADRGALERWRAQSKATALAATLGETDSRSLHEALRVERELLETMLPPAAALASELDAAQDERRRVEGTLARAEARLRGIEAQVADLRARRAREAELGTRVRALEAALAPVRHAIEVHELAADLLEETAADLARRVGPMLARFAAAVLPRLTAGRYGKVKVASDLEVRVYSPEKNDFVPLSDLSVGAADQLLLALRLGLMRAAVAAKGLGDEPHFLFLDEPLASFDEGRARAFIDILREHRDFVPQAFVVAHLRIHGLEDAFARVISPKIGSRTLGGGEGGNGRAAAGPAGGGAAREAETPGELSRT